MPVKKITISEFIALSKQHHVVDVRSPGEFTHAHFPGAYSLPLFTDEERKVVGTAYKQQGKQKAIKIGLEYFGSKMNQMIEAAEAICNEQQISTKTILVHCWRGGMRSAGVAWLLDLYGFDVYTLIGGYKSFRNWTLQQMENPYQFNVLGGYTGSAKTEMLHCIRAAQHAVIDLEGIAHHKGSAFGAIGQSPQPSQEMFENILALQLYQQTQHNLQQVVWVEDESQRIGNLNIPHSLWKTIRNSPLYFMDIPFEHRLKFIFQQYGHLEIQSLIDSTKRIEKRLGPNETKITIQYLKENNIDAAFSLLLQYYDKMYLAALQKRDNVQSKMKRFVFNEVEPDQNAAALITQLKDNNGTIN